jgi:hypothetical protein
MRIYMSAPAQQLDRVAPSQREETAIASVVAALQKMPVRLDWDRILVATPAYRALAKNGLGSKRQGFGVFNEPMCQAGCARLKTTDAYGLDQEPPDGVEAVTMDDKTIKARTYLAPFSYITVWILDPKTLAVLDKQQGFDSQKLAEPAYKPRLDMDNSDTQKYLANRIFSLIELSIGEAVKRSEAVWRRGVVEVGEPKLVPEGAGK